MSVRFIRVFILLVMMSVAAPAIAQDANGAGTRSAIPSTRNKPGLRSEGKKEKKEDKEEAEQEDGEAEAEGGEQGGAKANGAGTRSAIPSTRNKPGLRREVKKEEKADKEEVEQEESSAKAAP